MTCPWKLFSTLLSSKHAGVSLKVRQLPELPFLHLLSAEAEPTWMGDWCEGTNDCLFMMEDRGVGVHASCGCY